MLRREDREYFTQELLYIVFKREQVSFQLSVSCDVKGNSFLKKALKVVLWSRKKLPYIQKI
jgi:hypothetical protein